MSPHYLAMFCWGAAAAIANALHRVRPATACGLAAGVASVALIALCIRWGRVPSRMFVLDFFAGTVATAALVIAARTANPLRRTPQLARLHRQEYSLAFT